MYTDLKDLITFKTYIEGKKNILADCFLQLPWIEWIITEGDKNNYETVWNFNNQSKQWQAQHAIPINFHQLKVNKTTSS